MKYHYHTRNVVWGKIPQHVSGQYISHSFAMRVEESREEDGAAGYIKCSRKDNKPQRG